jgi:hypothetical protein
MKHSRPQLRARRSDGGKSERGLTYGRHSVCLESAKTMGEKAQVKKPSANGPIDGANAREASLALSRFLSSSERCTGCALWSSMPRPGSIVVAWEMVSIAQAQKQTRQAQVAGCRARAGSGKGEFLAEKCLTRNGDYGGGELVSIPKKSRRACRSRATSRVSMSGRCEKRGRGRFTVDRGWSKKEALQGVSRSS